MAHKITHFAVAILMLVPVATLAKPFSEIVSESIGYVNIGPNVVLIEDEVSSRVCRVDVSDAFFDAYEAADATQQAAARSDVTCVPTLLFTASAVSPSVTPQPFNTMIDESISYLQVAPGQILVEGEAISHLCRVQVTSAYFDAFEQGDGDALRAAAPRITCVELDALTK